jgi:alpha-glucosidase (family GH31 glycosyl hydrolase)
LKNLAVRSSTVLIVALMALVVASPSHAAPNAAPPPVISSGSLSARVQAHPFRISFSYSGRSVLDTLSGPAGLYAPFSFSRDPVPPWGGQPDQPDAGTWCHSLDVRRWSRSGGTLRLEVTTDDPSGCALLVALTAAGEGSIRVHAEPAGGAAGGAVTSMAASFATAGDEHFLGFGERENAVDQAGRTVESWAVEGAFNPADVPFVPFATPLWAISGRTDATYFPMPWFVSSRGYGYLLENTERSVFRLRSDRPDAWAVAADAPRIDYRVFGGPKPLDVVRKFSAAVGRQPAPAAPWQLGPWWQPTGPDSASLPERFREEDVPGSVIQTYTHYLPGGGQVGRRDQEKAMVKGLQGSGYAVTTYFNPMVSLVYSPVFSEAVSQGALLKCVLGLPFVFRYNQFLVAQVDFTSEAGRALYASLLTEAVEDGHDGWMEDFGEYTPPLSVAADGTPARSLHNRYPVDYHRGSWLYRIKAGKPLVTFVRSGYTGSARYSPVVWGGDPSTDWGYDGLPGAVRQGLNLGASGVGFYGSDTGGYFSVMNPPTTAELLIRWLEVGAFSGVMRTESQGWAMPWWEWFGLDRAQIWDPGVLPIWRRYAKLRTQMYPYVDAASRAYVERGVPLMVDVRLAYPDDPASWSGPLRYMFGPDILVAPVLQEGARESETPLPPGKWRSLWQAVRYEAGDGSFHVAAAPVLAGGAGVKVGAPLEEIPAFVRAGAMLPLLAPDVDTLADYGVEPGLVHLADRSDCLHLLAWPDGRSRVESLGTSIDSTLEAESWRLDFSGKALRSIDIEAQLPRGPVAVLWNGRPLGAGDWSFSEGVLRLSVSGLGKLKVNLQPAG